MTVCAARKRFRIPSFLILFAAVAGFAPTAFPIEAPPIGAAADLARSSTITYLINEQTYEFSSPGLENSPVYSIKLADPRTSLGLLHVTVNLNNQRIIPAYQGGLWVQNATGQAFSPMQIAGLGQCAVTGHSIIGDRLQIDFMEPVFGSVLQKRYSYKMRGRTLQVEISDLGGPQPDARYIGFSFGPTRYVGRPEIIQFPTSPIPVIQSRARYYLSTYIDPFRSVLNRYTYNASVESARMVHVSNTPAWLDLDENAAPVKAVAYFTVSEDPVETLPSRPPLITPESSSLRKRMVQDWSERPFLPEPQGYVTLKREWEAPANGPVSLNGVFRLAAGGRALCEIVLERSGEAPRLLFTQMLDEHSKPSTGMQGDIPMYKGDRLSFRCQTPAILSRGQVDFRAQLRQGASSYDSIDGFSNLQGGNQWYYSQQHGEGESLLVWSPDAGRYESPDTRSSQTAASFIVRSGSRGDAAPNAQRFFEGLFDFGALPAQLVLRNWNDHAVESIDDSDTGEDQWLSREGLRGIEQWLIGSGAMLLDTLPGEESVDMDSLKSLTITDSNADDDLIAFLEDFSTPGEETPAALPDSQPPSVAPPDDPRLTRAVYRFASNIPQNDLLPSVLPMAVDDALLNQRASRPTVGFGGYARFVGEPEADWLDGRFFPFDEYLTATAAFARVPHFTDRVWRPGEDPRGERIRLIETLSLLQPLSRETLDPLNAVRSIEYINPEGESGELKSILLMKRIDNALSYTRLRVEYANGLTLYANRSPEAWEESGIGLSADAIAPSGFAARNPSSGLLALIGERRGSLYSAASTPGRVFIHSRDGSLLRFEGIATDGLCRVEQRATSGLWQGGMIGARETSHADTLAPMLRASMRIDAVWRWTGERELRVTIMRADGDEGMLEVFELPQQGWNDDDMTVERMRARSSEWLPVEWSRSSLSGKNGIRIVDMKAGDVYRIQMP